jgi:FAD/FMN-containing dehydrogenase
MCRTNFLPTGICPAARRYVFAGYHPHGRMDLAVALYDGELEVTEELVRIVESCLLCPICDRQCYFITGLRPSRVLQALADVVDQHRRSGHPAAAAPADDLVDDLGAVVGRDWVSNDPAALAAYSGTRLPGASALQPRCVVLPGSTSEVAAVVRTARQHGVDVVPRGNGTSLAGATTAGVLVDCTRLSTLRVDADNFTADIGSGVTGLALQRAAHRNGLRANTAEPAACVCANVISTNLHSLFSHSYGVGADDVIDAELVTYDGRVLDLDAATVAGLVNYRSDVPAARPPAVCTRMTIKLHPVPDDEDAVAVPFDDLSQAIDVARGLCQRRQGAAVGVVSVGYAAAFLAATDADARHAARVLREDLGVKQLLIVVGDRFALDAVRNLCDPVLDTATMRQVVLGLSNLGGNEGLRLLAETEGEVAAFRELFQPDVLPVLTMALRASVETATARVDQDLRPFFRRLYRQPEMSDLRWLTTFRIVSARISRGRTFVPRLVWCPADPGLVDAVVTALARVGEEHNLPHGFGYLVPIDLGRRAVVEFDYFYDQSDPIETEAMARVMTSSVRVLERLRAEHPGLVDGRQIALQGLARPDSYLYRTNLNQKRG